MPRRPRVDYPGAFHHVMQRGARRAPVFARRDDCVLLLDTVRDAIGRFNVEVHAFSLMPDHYHLLLRSVQGDLSRFMQHLDGLYTRRLNLRHRWDGRIFRGRFQSQLVERPRHLRYLVPYIHLNPVRANLVKRPDDECWTSHRAYLGLSDTPAWLTTRYILRLIGGKKELAMLVTGLHQGRASWPADFDLESGLFTDDEHEDGDAAAERARAAGPRPTPAAVLARAAAITGVSLAGLREATWGPGGNPARRYAAWALVRHGGLNHAETARQLGMTATGVSKVLGRMNTPSSTSPIPGWMKKWTA